MKKLFLITLMVTAFVSCKNDGKSKDANAIEAKIPKEQSEDLTLLTGSYVYFEGAAVLQTSSDIYGVLITEKAEELNRYADNYKKEPTDMVQVEIKGKISNQKDDKILWDNKVEIIKILEVKALPKEENNVVKLGKE